MNRNDEAGAPTGPAEAGSASSGLYPGDTGQLPEGARRVLVQLLAGPSLDAKRHGRLWTALRQHEAVVRSRLAELFLDLVVDSDLEVAFTRQADTGEMETPKLLRQAPLTFLQSVLLLYLRQLLADAGARGERAIVSGEEAMEHMKLYEPEGNTDRVGFEKRVRAAIEKAKDHSLISPIRGSEDRYEISPTLKLLFSADEVAGLGRQYAALRDASPGGTTDGAE